MSPFTDRQRARGRNTRVTIQRRRPSIDKRQTSSRRRITKSGQQNHPALVPFPSHPPGDTPGSPGGYQRLRSLNLTVQPDPAFQEPCIVGTEVCRCFLGGNACSSQNHQAGQCRRQTFCIHFRLLTPSSAPAKPVATLAVLYDGFNPHLTASGSRHVTATFHTTAPFSRSVTPNVACLGRERTIVIVGKSDQGRIGRGRRQKRQVFPIAST